MSSFRQRGREQEAREDWSRERERYLVLLHIHNLAAEGGCLTAASFIRDLALRAAEAEAIIRDLTAGGLLRQSVVGGGIELTPEGSEYIERRAGRRRSVRLLR